MLLLEFEMNREQAELAQHTPRRAPRAGKKEEGKRPKGASLLRAL